VHGRQGEGKEAAHVLHFDAGYQVRIQRIAICTVSSRVSFIARVHYSRHFSISLSSHVALIHFGFASLCSLFAQLLLPSAGRQGNVEVDYCDR
jgi:hypothetical protein